MKIDIPGRAPLLLEDLVLDFNGTLACDGILCNGVRERLDALAGQLRIHVVTGDTFGHAAAQLEGVPCTLNVLPSAGQLEAKRAYVDALGAERAVCIGNGFNDRLMLEAAGLSIAILQDEGVATGTLLAADIVVKRVVDALDLLLKPLRLVATLRH